MTGAIISGGEIHREDCTSDPTVAQAIWGLVGTWRAVPALRECVLVRPPSSRSPSPPGWLYGDFSCAGVENRNADDLALLVSDDDIVVRQLAVIGMAWLLEVETCNVRLLIVAGPHAREGETKDSGNEAQNLSESIGGICTLQGVYRNPHSSVRFFLLMEDAVNGLCDVRLQELLTALRADAHRNILDEIQSSFPADLARGQAFFHGPPTIIAVTVLDFHIHYLRHRFLVRGSLHFGIAGTYTVIIIKCPAGFLPQTA